MKMKYKDYYQILGINRDDDQASVKKSYRKLARKYHPDVSKLADAEEKFKEVNEAYEVLKDPEKRAAYDRFGNDWQAGQDFSRSTESGQQFDFGGGGYTSASSDQFSDFFESIFGRNDFSGAYSNQQGYTQRGQDIHAKLSVSIDDAYLGNSQKITYKQATIGADGHSKLVDKSINVKIPKGVIQGQSIRLRNQGNIGFGAAAPGDLYLQIDFIEHPVFRTQSKNVLLTVPLAPWEASLGAKVVLPIPSGSVELKISENSQSGQLLRLKGKGIPSKVPGDLLVELEITVPPVKTPEERAACLAFAEAFSYNPRSKFEG